MGILTSPNEIDPFQSGLATAPLQLPFRFQPVVEVVAVTAAALEIPQVRPRADVVLARLGRGIGRPLVGRGRARRLRV
jgi:hypothetical protein